MLTVQHAGGAGPGARWNSSTGILPAWRRVTQTLCSIAWQRGVPGGEDALRHGGHAVDDLLQRLALADAQPHGAVAAEVACGHRRSGTSLAVARR